MAHVEMLTSPIIREMLIKATVSYYFTSTRIDAVKTKIKNKVGEDVEKFHSHIASRNVKWCSYFRKQFGGS